MARSNIVDVQRTIEVDKVKELAVTSAVQDQATGKWVRELRILGEPVTNEEPTNVLTIRFIADQREQLNLVAPEQTF